MRLLLVLVVEVGLVLQLLVGGEGGEGPRGGDGGGWWLGGAALRGGGGAAGGAAGLRGRRLDSEGWEEERLRDGSENMGAGMGGGRERREGGQRWVGVGGEWKR